MAKRKGISGISGWVFIIIGLIVIAVSIFFYDTLKIFIAIGGFMVLYGLGKLSYDKLKESLFPKEEEEEPVNLDKVPNPYLQRQQQRAQQLPAPAAQQVLAQHQRPMQHPVVRQQYQATHAAARPVGHPQHRAAVPSHGHHYCHSCGTALRSGDRFCSLCGARVQ